MKFLLSALLFALLATPVQEDQNKYLLIYTAFVYQSPFNNGNYVLTGTSSNILTSQPPNQWSDAHYDARNQVFSSFEDAQSFISNHTIHYLDGGGYTQPWDFAITDITGFYRLRKLESTKIKVGNHTEYVTTSQEVQKPTYEWSINE